MYFSYWKKKTKKSLSNRRVIDEIIPSKLNLAPVAWWDLNSADPLRLSPVVSLMAGNDSNFSQIELVFHSTSSGMEVKNSHIMYIRKCPSQYVFQILNASVRLVEIRRISTRHRIYVYIFNIFTHTHSVVHSVHIIYASSFIVRRILSCMYWNNLEYLRLA